LAALRAGKKTAVRQWFSAFAPYLLRLALRRVKTAEDAEEIVQETFLNCLKQLPLFRGQARLRTWMVSILHHEIADYYRKLYAKRALKITPLADFILAEPLQNSSETAALVRSVLAQMAHEKKELLMMKYVDRKRVEEIARVWNKTVKAVESELFRARREFRALYAQAAGE
jgi:RNA polymerase sigma-70 factor (ECF subfamily)